MRVRVQLLLLLALSGLSFGEKRKECHTSRCEKEAKFLRSCIKPEVNPCANFYEYACGNFERNHPLPPGEQSWDIFDMASNTTLYHLKHMLEIPVSLTDTAALQKVKIMYQTCTKMDQLNGILKLRNVIKQLGGWPLIDGMSPVKSINWNTIAHTIKQFGIPIFLDVYVIPDLRNGGNVLKIGRAEDVGHLLYMPQHETEPFHWRKLKKSALSFKNSTFALETSMLIKLALQMKPNANKFSVSAGVKATMELSSQLQGTSDYLLEIFETEDMTVEELQKRMGMAYEIVFGNLEIKVHSKLRVKVSPSVRDTLKIVAGLSQEELANYITGRVLLQLAADVNEDYRQAMLKILRKNKMATEGEIPCWRHCIARITGLGLDLALSSNFLKKRDLNHVDHIAHTLQKSSLKLLQKNSWLDDKTLQLVENKTRKMKVLSGFPSWSFNSTLVDLYYKKLIIQPDDHIGNVIRLRSFCLGTKLSILHNMEKNKQTVWPTTPFIANAFYQFQHNSVVLPAGLLQHPIYMGSNRRIILYKNKNQHKLLKKSKHSLHLKESLLLILDYARLGAIIGHEMTHAFDDSGHCFDEFGKMRNGWTSEAEQIFNFKTLCFIRQYGKSFPSFRTLDENISDNGGIRKAYHAYKKAWKRYDNISTLPGLTALTPDQLFFLGYATLYCQAGQNDYDFDEHSQKHDRATWPLFNMPEFAKAWGCPVPKGKRCKLW